LDWITATFKPDDAGAAAINNLCEHHWAATKNAGGVVEVLAPLKYHGVRGGGIFFGSRADGHMIQMSGPIANVWYKEITKYGSDPNITRLDLEVTAYREPKDFNFAPRYRNQVRRFERMMGRARPVVLNPFDKNLSGDSLMIGDRKSEFHMRIYDKSDESEGLVPPNLTRWEAENKDVLGKRLWKELKAGESPQVLARNHNLDRMLRLGINPEWAAQAVPMHYTPTREKSDAYRRLMWLANDVSKTVATLVEEGYEHEVINALGLQEVVEQLARDSLPGLKQRLHGETWKAPPVAPKMETFITPEGARAILDRRDKERDKRTRERLQKIARETKP
jgi:hypothetical protein